GHRGPVRARRTLAGGHARTRRRRLCGDLHGLPPPAHLRGTVMSISLVSIYPTLLGTYGDGGNVMALQHRARLHGLDLEVVQVDPGDPVPESADLYVLGGGEDSAQTAAATALRTDGALKRAADNGAAVLAICAGYQLLGEYFPDATSTPTPGLGILDVRTDRLPKRAVGELAATAKAPLDQILTGYE